MLVLVPVRRASLLIAALAFPACGLDPDPPPPTLMAPQPRTPMSNAYIGSVHVPTSLMPTFSWAPSDDAAPASSYEVQISTDPAFARALLTLTTADTLVKPMFELPASRQVPVGTRYYWRVRACDDADCSEFSSARTLNLGSSDHDVNGDGFADILVGRPTYDGDGLGRVEIYLGGSDTAFDGESDSTLVAPVAKDHFGTRVAFAGDFNGDGFGDVIVGASEANNQAGAAYVYFGGPTTFDPTPDLVLQGNAAGDRFASALGGAGDLNSDGFADLVIGAPNVGGNRGAVYVYLGASDGGLAMRTPPAQSKSLYFGLEVAAAGDIDGDGYGDLAVGMNPSAGGRGSVFFGDATDALSMSRPLRELSVGPIAGGSDVNGDGFADLLVSSGGRGTATLFFGGPDRMALGTFAAPYGEPDPGFSSSVALPGDVDGDGFDDVLIGASERYQGGVGGAFLYAGGPKSSFSTIAYSKIVGPMGAGMPSSEWFVASPNDVNGDSFADLAIGSVSSAPSASGMVLIYTGGSRQALDAPAYATLRSR